MKSFFIVLGIASLMGFATCAHASGELVSSEGYEMCRRMAELAELESPDLDFVGETRERVQADCELAELSWELGVGNVAESLNDLVAVDGEPVWPACRFEGGCVQ